MPHKHKRRQKDANTYDLPPTIIAKPLPVRDPKSKPTTTKKGKQQQPQKPQSETSAASATSASRRSKSNSKPKSTNPTGWADDTPRAFRRMMQFQSGAKGAQKRKRNIGGSEDEESDSEGGRTSGQKKKKRNAPTPTSTTKKIAKEAQKNVESSPSEEEEVQTTKPQIMPGEKLSDFAARVDREMPLSHMKRSTKPAAADMPKIRETRVTKHEKHLRRLQEQWRKDDKEILEREAAEREEREEEMEEQLRLWDQWETEAGKRKAKKSGGGAKKKEATVVRDDPDPWAKLKRERMNKQISPLDVVQAPPQLTKPREIFKVRGGAKVDVANVPAAVGSLRRREELASERRNIVEEYRRLMAEKRRA
ncbi:uncharacterized protein BO80DRAFT_399230 [Aspergillus ibericus CBS 121593]|uniref:Urease accessory protein UreD n=1 Tax=Aspergillus ibericus CBS 121593 TaxID=1448316 RepID=A0A395HB77_9EURO|nr:hypothetical protein BO80DRAFT_399230 [Aspergillus ibericus CBS 121593]RAL04753.1 hypothetical protein BO80DRAFT_399230 [Aspergillus ibericus CBS 121593]